MNVSDRIHLAVWAEAELLDAIKANQAYIMAETLGTRLEFDPALESAHAAGEVVRADVDGLALWFRIRVQKPSAE